MKLSSARSIPSSSARYIPVRLFINYPNSSISDNRPSGQSQSQGPRLRPPLTKLITAPSRSKPANSTNSPHKPPRPRESTSTPYICLPASTRRTSPRAVRANACLRVERDPISWQQLVNMRLVKLVSLSQHPSPSAR